MSAEMDISKAASRIDELRGIINEANRLYYVENSPVLSDYDFDMLLKELEALEVQFPEFITEDSPTRRVGSDLIFNSFTQDKGKSQRRKAVAKEFEQYPHRYPMLSLANTYDLTEIEAFADRVTKDIGSGFTYSCELKFDGTAICLTYSKGKLVRALTRGDGTVGDDVTANAMQIRNIPQTLTIPKDFTPTSDKPYPWPEEFEIRGEVYMPWSAFDRLNLDREKDDEQPFANPRNAASGSLKLTDRSIVADRGLECVLYHLLGEDLPFETHAQAIEAASRWGLPVSDALVICKDINGIENFISYWDEERKKLPFATDGIVIKVNELQHQSELGYTAKSPRWAVAYKFKAEQALTRLVSIDYQVGRTGAITPVANLDPVQLSGTVVKRASLHNEEQMELLDIRIGDYVYVEKGGEIIPKITGVELTRREDNAVRPDFPKTCPDCGTPVVKDKEEAKTFCPNQNGCPMQIKGRLIHFLSRKAMNVIAGEATVDQMYEKALVWNVADFYDLDIEHLLMLEGWKERSAERFLSSLRESVNVPFERVLYALGIRHVGETTARSIARHFGNIDAIIAASEEELMKVEDVGSVIAASVRAYFQDEANLEVIKRLKAAGLSFKAAEAKGRISSVLEGKTIVISGNFSVSREHIKELIASHGGKNSGSVSGKTTWLLAGEKAGPEKLKKAETLGISVIGEEEFRKIIDPDDEGMPNDEPTLF